jgi:hypothetical protein
MAMELKKGDGAVSGGRMDHRGDSILCFCPSLALVNGKKGISSIIGQRIYPLFDVALMTPRQRSAARSVQFPIPLGVLGQARVVFGTRNPVSVHFSG